MSVIYAKGNEEVTNSDHTNVCFTINGSLKILPRHFHCSNFKMTFDKNLMKKSYHFLTSSKFYYVAKFCVSSSMITKNTLWIIPKICGKKICLLSTCELKIYEIINFCNSRICVNCCFKITNQSYIS